MTTEIYGKYKRSSTTPSDIESWYINDVLLKQNETVLDNLILIINSIKRDDNHNDNNIVNVPILSNTTFKGIFKKKANTDKYTAFNLKLYDGLKLRKEYTYKNKLIEIPQLKEIYGMIDTISTVLTKKYTSKDEYRNEIIEINNILDSIIKVFNNEDRDTVDIVLDSNLTIQIYLIKDSMVIKFKLKNSLVTIGYINDPFVINLYSKIIHLKYNIKLLAWNFSQIKSI